MSPRRTDLERIQDLLDGLLSPAEEAEVRQVLEQRADLARELKEMTAVVSLLNTPLDVAPPPDLVARVLAATRAEAPQRAWRRLPARIENALVLAGSVGLAGVVAALGQAAGPSGAEWIARLVIASTRLFSFAKVAVVGLAEWDWAVRLLETLGRASATVGSSALPLLSLSLVALAITALLGVTWLRGTRSLRSGGFGHAHLLA
jgi:anti-sigma factor RsiW